MSAEHQSLTRSLLGWRHGGRGRAACWRLPAYPQVTLPDGSAAYGIPASDRASPRSRQACSPTIIPSLTVTTL